MAFLRGGWGPTVLIAVLMLSLSLHTVVLLRAREGKAPPQLSSFEFMAPPPQAPPSLELNSTELQSKLSANPITIPPFQASPLSELNETELQSKELSENPIILPQRESISKTCNVRGLERPRPPVLHLVGLFMRSKYQILSGSPFESGLYRP
jgi:hypothetical protein